MRILACTLLMLTVVACSSKGSTEPDAVSQQAAPANCTYVTTATHSFRDWGQLTADEYTCVLSDFAKMTCKFYYEAGGHREIQCQDTSHLDPQTPPADCNDYLPAGSTQVGLTRHFFNGSYMTVAGGAMCDSRYSLRCTFYSHDSDSTGVQAADDLQCVD
jgi:hypothetical protein